ncbi:hypothetical protein [Paraburkholderia sp. XV]|uniref:hypothetical protein n=1 Tax=Paraburkholderia sp. XV TaxID=2831520 RepID=UPI001CD7C10E|nr:hypothetical protein [Paraburkholderia sp. XV]
MRAADVLRELGRPIAYYPYLSRYLGGVNAAVLFCQIFYWQDKTTSELGVHKTSAELENETGLSYEEQRSARAALRDSGVLIETEKRIEHKIYFRIDEDALEQILAAGPAAKKPRKARAPKSKKPAPPLGKSPLPEMGKVHSGELEKSSSGNGESPPREVDKDQPPNLENPSPPTGQNLVRGAGEVQVVNVGVTTAETTAAATRASDAVDNSAAAAADSKNEKPDTELQLAGLLIELERARGKELTIDRSRDRVHVLRWVADGLTLEQLREAHASAVAARKRDTDDRPTYVGFVATFVDALLAAENAPPGSTAGADPAEWHLTPEGVDARAAELSVRPRKAEEDWRYYRVLVVKASKDRRAAEFVLADATRFNALDLYQFARRAFGDALMPIDDYAS